jgi:Sortase domain
VPRPSQIPLTLPPSVPTWLRIPAIGVSAPVKPMGLLRDGFIQVPPLVPHSNLVGWYKYSPLPGELGPAVLVGHRDSDGVAVFFLLGDLRRGERIYIHRADGSTAIFTVTKVQNFEKSTFPSTLVYGPTPYSALRVITCGGVFNYAIGSYEQNIVVYATLTGARTPRPRKRHTGITSRVIPPTKPPAHSGKAARHRGINRASRRPPSTGTPRK